MWLLPNVYPAAVSRSPRAALVYSPHGCLSPVALKVSRWKKLAFWKLFQERGFAQASLIHATSEAELEDVRAFGITKPVVLLPNGVDIPDAMPEHSPRSQTVLYLGRLHPIKGIDVLLHSWKRLKEDGFSDWTLRIVGPDGVPGYRRTLELQVRDHAIPDVVFRDAAFGSSKWTEYGTASVFVLPSRSENFGMTVAESLAAGTPVITTDRTPWSELPRVGCGWQVPLRVDSLGDALHSALAINDAERELMGARGKAWVLKAFSWQSIAADMASAYEWARFGGCPPPTVHLT
jgi:glycosyltransferase involved in cell wall biosynthesis